MIIEETRIIGGSNLDKVPLEAFGREVSLKYLKKTEWENAHSFGKKDLKKVGQIIEIIQKGGPNSTNISPKNRVILKPASMKHDSRFYKAIKDNIGQFKEHYEFKFKKQSANMRIMMSFTDTKGYLICFDHNHSALNTGK